MPYPRRIGAAAVVFSVTALAGCGGGAPSESAGSFPPLRYGFLPPIRLNVASIEVENEAPPTDLAAQSPVSPAEALTNMAHDRLQADGPTGTAVFTVTDASIVRTDDGLTAHLAAHLDIQGAGGTHAGYAEAEVSRSATGDAAAVGPATLYALTSQAMQDMNVELEYQVRTHLADWIVSPGAAVEAPVSATPLTPGGAAGGAAIPPGGTPLPLAPPPASVPSEAPGAPTELAPPAGYAAPPGTPVAPPLPESEAPPPPGETPPTSPEPMSPPPGYLGLPPTVPADPGATPDIEVPPPSSQAYPPAASGGY